MRFSGGSQPRRMPFRQTSDGDLCHSPLSAWYSSLPPFLLQLPQDRSLVRHEPGATIRSRGCRSGLGWLVMQSDTKVISSPVNIGREALAPADLAREAKSLARFAYGSGLKAWLRSEAAGGSHGRSGPVHGDVRRARQDRARFGPVGTLAARVAEGISPPDRITAREAAYAEFPGRAPLVPAVPAHRVPHGSPGRPGLAPARPGHRPHHRPRGPDGIWRKRNEPRPPSRSWPRAASPSGLTRPTHTEGPLPRIAMPHAATVQPFRHSTAQIRLDLRASWLPKEEVSAPPPKRIGRSVRLEIRVSSKCIKIPAPSIYSDVTRRKVRNYWNSIPINGIRVLSRTDHVNYELSVGFPSGA